MPKYQLVVFSNPQPGQEDAYNDWYTNTHLRDVVAVPGVVSAQRFKVNTVALGSFGHRYMAIYEMETNDPEAVMGVINQRSGTEAMVLSEAIDAAGTGVLIVEPYSDIVYAGDV